MSFSCSKSSIYCLTTFRNDISFRFINEYKPTAKYAIFAGIIFLNIYLSTIGASYAGYELYSWYNLVQLV